MGIHFFLALPKSDASEIPRQLLSRGKPSVRLLVSVSGVTQFRITWQKVRGTTEIISYRGKIGISPFHKYFPRFPSSHLPCPKETQP